MGGHPVDEARVLVIEDEADVRSLVVRLLSEEGYQVDEAEDALSAMARFGAQRPDLVVLDVMLPDVDGLDLLARIRQTDDVPVLVLTGQGDEKARVAGLRGGADDYVIKPFYADELLARVDGLLRRSRTPSAPSTTTSDVLSFDGLEIDGASHEVRVDGELVTLTAKEFGLLSFLARSPRQVFSREQLLQHVWDSSGDWQDEATVTEHVRRLRRRIEKDPDDPRHIVTVRGVGYRFEP